MKLNKEKLDQMVEAVMKLLFPYEPEDTFDAVARRGIKEKVRTALTPFCMEMTDEEIDKEGDKRSYFIDDWPYYERGFNDGAKFIRDGK